MFFLPGVAIIYRIKNWTLKMQHINSLPLIIDQGICLSGFLKIIKKIFLTYIFAIDMHYINDPLTDEEKTILRQFEIMCRSITINDIKLEKFT